MLATSDWNNPIYNLIVWQVTTVYLCTEYFIFGMLIVDLLSVSMLLKTWTLSSDNHLGFRTKNAIKLLDIYFSLHCWPQIIIVWFVSKYPQVDELEPSIILLSSLQVTQVMITLFTTDGIGPRWVARPHIMSTRLTSNDLSTQFLSHAIRPHIPLTFDKGCARKWDLESGRTYSLNLDSLISWRNWLVIHILSQ